MKKILFLIVFFAVCLVTFSSLAWEVDFSRRQNDMNKSRSPQGVVSDGMGQILEKVLETGEGQQDVVILHTDQGFVPSMVHVKQNQSVRVFVVNVSQKDKNSSFVLDSFSQAHGIYYGQLKEFSIRPKVEGEFSFVCPESGAKGRLLVYKAQENKSKN